MIPEKPNYARNPQDQSHQCASYYSRNNRVYGSAAIRDRSWKKERIEVFPPHVLWYVMFTSVKAAATTQRMKVSTIYEVHQTRVTGTDVRAAAGGILRPINQ